MRRSIRSFAVSSVLCLTSVASVQADGSSEPAGYRALVDEAVAEHQAGNFSEARGLFSRAHAMYPNARTLKGMGMAEFELRNYRESAEYLEAALASSVKPLTPALRAEAQTLLQRAQRLLGTIRLLVSPPGTRITIDGVAPLVSADGGLRLSVGDHALEARAAGYEPERRTLKINGGEDQSLTLALTPLTQPAAAAVQQERVAADSGTSAPRPQGSLDRARSYAGFNLGLAGNNDTIKLGLSPGGQLGAIFWNLPFFDLGAELRIRTLNRLEFTTTVVFDLGVKPRVRYVVSSRRAELFLSLPIGFSLPWRHSGSIPGLFWNLGVGGGASQFITDSFGLTTELLWIMSYDIEAVDASFTQLSWFVSGILTF